MKGLNERVDFIRKVICEAEKNVKKGNTPRTYTIRGWRETYLVKPIIKLHVDYLMFRIGNSRTLRQQISYLSNNPDLSDDFFKDPEASVVQKAQEEILLSMINSSSTGKDFLEDLDSRGQDEPTIITFEGYLVNGNRRTAALKDIGKEFVDCVVLPEDATKRDIYALEHLLQISEDFKEDYHWINELINFYQGIHDQSLSFNKDQMAKSFRIKRSELEKKLRTMDLVSEFLSWKGIPNHYDYEKLDYAEQPFKELEKATKKTADEHERQELIHAVFNLLEEPPTKGRLYSHVTSLIREWGIVYPRIIDELKQDTTRAVDDSSETIISQGDVLLDEIIEVSEEAGIDVFSNSDNAEEMSKIILETVADVKAEKKEQGEVEAVYEGVSSALRELQSLVVDVSSTKLESTKNKLEQIITVTKKLLDQIAKVK